jgi:phosphohistidine phosphatase SixA
MAGHRHSFGPVARRALPALLFPAAARAEARLAPADIEAPGMAPLLARLRAGGLVLFFRHADTIGENCDRSFRVGDRPGQRNISPRGRAQSAAIGARLAALGIPVALPVLAGPVYRARDTAEHAFGAANVVVTESLLADDFSGPRLAWVLDEHRRLFAAPVPAGTNRVLVGHRTPGIMVFGDRVAGRAFPEGAALVIEPGGAQGRVLGIAEFAAFPDGGFHNCQ